MTDDFFKNCIENLFLPNLFEKNYRDTSFSNKTLKILQSSSLKLQEIKGGHREKMSKKIMSILSKSLESSILASISLSKIKLTK